MKIFHDWEFLEDGERIYPIAVAMCSSDGRELYCVFEEIEESPLKDRIRKHSWLMGNVVPYLPLRDGKVTRPLIDLGTNFFLDASSNLVMPRRMIRNAVREFVLANLDDGEELELWGWYSSYDHVALSQLFGSMIRLPQGFPMFTRDLKQRWTEFKRPESELPGMTEKNHDPRDEVRLMRDWDLHMDELTRAGERYGLV